MPRLSSLGLKLNLALVFFFLMLGGLTSVLILYGFNRTQDDAKTRSREALEEVGELALLGVVAGQADYGGLAFDSAADIGNRAARYLATFQAAGQHRREDRGGERGRLRDGGEAVAGITAPHQ